MTNEEKFKEVFGIVPSANFKRSVCPDDFYCRNINCADCLFYEHWWQKEYKPCFRLEEAYKAESEE